MEKGGAERVIALLSNYFSKDDSVSILTLTKSKDAYKLDSSVKRLHVDKTSYKSDNRIKKMFRKLSLARLFRLKKIIIAEKPDAIISFLPEPSLRLMFIAKFSRRIRKIPKIISIRNDPIKEYGSFLIKNIMRHLYKKVDGMVYQTGDAKKFFKDIIKTKNQITIPNPIDENVLLNPEADECRNNYIVSVGRLEAQKNHEMLIGAFYDTLKMSEHDYVLKIYGEGSRRDDLERLINELHLNDRVFLEGQVDDVAQKLNDARIFALSSHYEGMPNALMEAMAMGLACISTDCPCGGPRTLIQDGKNGVLVKNNDRKALSLALNRLICDAKSRKKMAKNAVLIRKSNNVNIIADRWKTLIMNVTGAENE
jgi:glycosyltransferase involved in cell wall biosynthesis